MSKKQFLAQYGHAGHIDSIIDTVDNKDYDNIIPKLIGNPSLASHQIDKLVALNSFQVYQHPNIRQDHIDTAFEDNSDRKLQYLARNPALSDSNIHKMVNHTEPHIRQSIAVSRVNGHRLTPEHIESLVNDPNVEVRKCMAWNHRVEFKPHQIEKFLSEKSHHARGFHYPMLQQKNITKKQLETIVNTGDDHDSDKAKWRIKNGEYHE